MKKYLVPLLLILADVAVAQEPKLMLPIGHTSYLHSVVISPDGKHVVTAAADNTLKLWDAESGELLNNISNQKDIRSAVFSPDGRKILASAWTGVKIWDTYSGNIIKTIDECSSFDNTLVSNFSPDSKRVIVGSTFYSIKGSTAVMIWDAAQGTVVNIGEHSQSINSAVFSPDGSKVLTSSKDSTAKIWDADSGELLMQLKSHTHEVNFANFSHDGKKVVTTSNDSTAKIWDTNSGRLLFTLKLPEKCIEYAVFSSDGQKIAVMNSYDRYTDFKVATFVYSVTSGKLLQVFPDQRIALTNVFSPDDTKIVSVTKTDKYDYNEHVANIWDPESGQLRFRLNNKTNQSAFFSNDGTRILTSSHDYITEIWNAGNGARLTVLKGHTTDVASASFSREGKNIITANGDNIARIWNFPAVNIRMNLKEHRSFVSSASYSPDGNTTLTASGDSTVRIWDMNSGKPIKDLALTSGFLAAPVYSHDGKKIATYTIDSSLKIWNSQSGTLECALTLEKDYMVTSLVFSPDGKAIYLNTYSDDIRVYNVDTGLSFSKTIDRGTAISFSDDGKVAIATHSAHGIFEDHDTVTYVTKIIDDWTIRINKVGSGDSVSTLKGDGPEIMLMQFSPDGKRLLTSDMYDVPKIWDVNAGQFICELQNVEEINSAVFSADGTKVLTANEDNTCKVWNAETGELLFVFFAIDSTDYLVVDKYNRYDGSDGARKRLYFTCGTELIFLDQLKEQLWVGNLAERILRGDSINAKKLSELNICGLTPSLEITDTLNSQYRFKITPRSGGFGETVLYVNGNETKRYQPKQLLKTRKGYELIVTKQELHDQLIPGQDNPVSVKAYTSSNDISSRAVTVMIRPDIKGAPVPNLYAVMVGVSDYKGEGLDLKYAAKDANDLSALLGNSARKWLNKDGKEHVFLYNLTTEKDHYLFPEKKSIRKVFEDIGKKAASNDILLIFFAGHGVMQGTNKKQFYFLTADASKATAAGTAVADVGVSTQELIEWIQPASIKAQKRILILDACNSGQAINDIVKIGRTHQNYLAVRNDDNAQQIKSIDKLNERAGLFILSASASSQKAYETDMFSQGLLTYALLKGIKQNPEILEDNRYLNISRWFNVAEDLVTELFKDTDARQQPQIVSTSNFNIGIVDDEVRNSISLSGEKPLFHRSEFINADERVDNLRLRTLVNKQLYTTSISGTDALISYNSNFEGTDVFALSGDYKVNGNQILVHVILTKGGIKKVHQFEVTGELDGLQKLAEDIVDATVLWISKNK